MECEICKKWFKTLYYVNRHKRQVHKIESHPLKRGRPITSLTNNSTFKCLICNWTTYRKVYLRIHCINRHPEKYRKKQIHLKCPVDGCNKTLQSRRMDLVQHILDSHSDIFDKECSISDMHFLSFSDFLQWKSNEEKITMTKYILIGKKKGKSEKTNLTYVCHRSGMVKTRGKGIRPFKGSCKIGKVCPAVMSVSHDTISGTVFIKYFKVHVGHGQDRSHSKLTRKEQKKIASQLSRNIPLNVILKNIQDSKVTKNMQIAKQKIEEINGIIDQIKDKLLDEKIYSNITIINHIHSSVKEILENCDNGSFDKNKKNCSNKMETIPDEEEPGHQTIFLSNKMEYIFV